MEPNRADDPALESVPWKAWVEQGIWGKTAAGAALLALIGAVLGAMSEVSSANDTHTVFTLYHAVEAIGRIAPIIAITSLLVEPARHRQWTYTALLLWAVASVVTASGHAYDIVSVLDSVN